MTFISDALYTTVSTDNTSTSTVGGRTTLNGAINDSTTTITVFDGSVYSDGQTIRIDSEYIIIDSVAGNDLTVQRGQFTSSGDSHSSGANVVGCFVGTGDQNPQPQVQVSLLSSNGGTEYFDFSNDGTSWDRFPSGGFTVTAGIHEFHIAVKSKRFFRVVYENGETSATTSFRVYTYFGFFGQGNLPLNQNIGVDADSTVVRAVGAGQAPDDTYANLRRTGEVFSTTETLPGTLLLTGISSGATGIISVEDTTDFGTSGYLLISTTEIVSGVQNTISEFVAYDSITSGTSINITERAQFGTSNYDHSSGDPVGGVYYTDVISTEGYSQVATKILSSNDGQMSFIWYSDEAGTNPVRTILPTYPPELGETGDFDFLAAPLFGSGTRYVFGNRDGTSQTDFYFASDFYTDALSSQILTVESGVLPQMTSNLTRAITVGKQPDGDYVNSPADGQAFETETPLLAGETYTSQWVDTDDWNVIEIVLISDAESAINGLTVNFTEDTEVAEIKFFRNYTYKVGFIDTQFIVRIPTTLDGFQVVYTNGPNDQTTMQLHVNLKTSGTTNSYNIGGALIVADFSTEVSLGNVTNQLSVVKFGRVSNLSAASSSDVWSSGGTYTGQPVQFTPETVQVISADANDTNGGSGAWKIYFEGLKTSTSREYEGEEITLNGGTVTTTSTWWRINRAYVLEAAEPTATTSGTNAGIITIRASSTTSVVFATIPAGFGQTQIAAYTIPYECTGVVKRVYLSCTRDSTQATSITASFRVRSPERYSVYRALAIYDLSSNFDVDDVKFGGLKIAGGSDIKIRADNVEQAGTKVNGELEFLIITNQDAAV